MGDVQILNLDPRVLAAANINPATGLATDYLNHYNEVAMMIGSLADMPDMADAVLAWRPVDYPEHFLASGFRDRDLAVAAWEAATPAIKDRFASVRREIDIVIAVAQVRLAADLSRAPAMVDRSNRVFDGISRLGAVINGGAPAVEAQKELPASTNISQDDIDSLFA